MMMTAGAQAQSSKVWAGGKIGYWHNDDAEPKEQLTISPEVGYDLTSKWSIAMGLGISYLDTDGGSATAVTFDPYARYKFYKNDRLTLFVDGGFGVATADASGWNIGIKPGLAYDINKRFSVVTHVGFLGYAEDYYNNGNGGGFGLMWNNTSLDLGLYFRF